MSDIKIVDSLEDWFDVLVVLADKAGSLSPAAEAFVAAFADRRSVHVMIPDGPDGPCRSDAAGPGARWRVHCPAAPGAARADSIARFLRDTNIRRPIVWVEDAAGYGATVEVLSEVYKVFHGAEATPAPPEVVDHCDLVLAASSQAADKVIGQSAFRGAKARWIPTEGYGVLEKILCARLNALLRADKRLNILVLYDDTFTHIKTVQEHLAAFGKHSRHNYFYFPARHDADVFGPFKDAWPSSWNFDDYDAVVWHYGLRAAHEQNIDPAVARELARYDGLKILFVQDDYDTTLTTWSWIERVGIHLVMTCIPPYGVPYAFPDWTPGRVEFIQTLTGFVPEDDMDRFIVPMEEREVRVAYRGRTLPFRYGSLAREKYLIGLRMKELAEERGVRSDITMDENSRIYGDDWYRFTAGARATLATESGSNVFDFDGSLAALSAQAEKDGVSYEAFFAEHLVEREQHVRMNQVSPRIFEAVRLKTALVCFEGEYSGVIRANEHFIPLKKDFSNADEVFAKLEDIDYLKALTERAYRDVIESGKWSHKAFIESFDRIVESRLLRPARRELLTATIARRERSGEISPVLRFSAAEFMLNTGLLRQPVTRVPFSAQMAMAREEELLQWDFRLVQTAEPPQDARVIATVAPEEFLAVGEETVVVDARGAVLTTPPNPWSLGAQAFLSLPPVDLKEDYCWVRAKFVDVEGSITFGAYNTTTFDLSERQLAVVDGEFEVIVRLSDDYDAIFVRTAAQSGPGRATFLGAEILTASAYPREIVDIARRLFEKGDPLLLEGGNASASALQSPVSLEPPQGACLLGRWNGTHVYPGGGAVIPEAEAVRVVAGGGAWSYAAALDIPLEALDFETHRYWVKVNLRDVSGDLRLALWSKADNKLAGERALRRREGAQTVFFPLRREDPATILFRKGQGLGAAEAVFESVEVLTAPFYPSWLIELSRRTPGPACVDADPVPGPERVQTAAAVAPAAPQPPPEEAALAGPDASPGRSGWRKLLGIS